MEPIIPPLKFTSHHNLVERLVLATIIGRPIRIKEIRTSSPTNPGVKPHEVAFIRLLSNITNAEKIILNETGTELYYKPGMIVGSATKAGAQGTDSSASTKLVKPESFMNNEYDRGLSYFLIPLCMLAPFAKTELDILFSGPGVITSSTPTGDMSVDSVRTAILPLYEKLGFGNAAKGVELRILKRSNPGPNGKGGGGEVLLSFKNQTHPQKRLHLMNPGRIKSIRGVAYSVGVSGSNNARMIETARGILNPLSPDTYIFSDVSSAPLIPAPTKNNPKAQKKVGLGFGLSLVAESSTGCLYSADVASPPAGGVPPEDIGKQCAFQLLETISKGGCIPPAAATTFLIPMTMGPPDVGRLQFGRDVIADPNLIQLGRDVTTFGAPGWGIRDAENEDGDVIVTVVGSGIENIHKKKKGGAA
ncbi:RNA 3'-terminal phosphate cyclase-like protein [Penicillium argentinense]|uniref:RNA 3'-terminal phosphate cyclase-like protein n=1 Tax=Penicillium argentinense TaxID=1131581 RepID=A0A9W9EPW0_9EURO|nr:RNA 3'-terminal phosphate cyclase-like protein [Penicillium argentinense]KAJ5085690.1 RNA 3'-terminal phosphate cyclase-like protein [Penicillium argentinense]